MTRYPDYLSKLIFFLRKLPGIGFKTAEKLAFELISWDSEQLKILGNAFHNVASERSHCPLCFTLKESKEADCHFCREERDNQSLCIVASPKDVFFLERSKVFKGRYHVLGSLLSPITGKHIENERLSILKSRIETLCPKEIILAIDATLEGDATALFLKQELQHFSVNISRLALGLPIGLSFDYVDSGTLARAFSGRHSY
ncbi:RecR [Chlamydia pneumoniae TW-183]|uniref:Recombination protein RecR n=2 Tax=Chlamydia pneumoniae TaxID=83558 RepID=RECR_CHLPN|nr:recombination mediator RecR [Chlamydia pneumoniae]Q9Z8N9.1 RecName: Full=Recombination protein RecR [Chlamydia pneumoniae]AAD18448.1 Recombination Protein [Chlamydia pneumoniae CWL029]AAF38296.1 recombination protein RecR [Chlamydia pneumoniae AR39]AAP98241.1 RecR [Chlamydia pneumoniae TW-183]ACZ33274.1 recombination protein RecR [Chlamydia pneumoniae LPCoLN]ETR80180.1 Recombination protein RecR [Chlamydia pneumoniae B21]